MPLSTAVGAGSYSAPVNFKIAQKPPDGITPADKAAFDEVYGAIQQIIFTFINNCGIGPQDQSQWAQFAGLPSTVLQQNMGRLYVTASEAVPAGAMVSLHKVGADLRVRKADATNNTKPADGFCSSPSGIALGDTGEIILGGGLATINGLTIATRYFLSTAAGIITPVAPVAAGNIEQYVGIALSVNQLYVNLGYWIQH